MKSKKKLLIIAPLICVIGVVAGVIHYKGKQVDSKNEASKNIELADNKKLDESANKDEVKDNNTTSEKPAVTEADNKQKTNAPDVEKKEESATTKVKQTDEVKNNKSEAKNEKWVYKKDGYYLYKTNSDKSKKVKVKTEPIWTYTIDGKNLYYISADEGGNGIELKSLYKVDLGTGVSKKLSDADTARLCVVGDDMYFDKNEQVFTIKTNGTGLTKISKEKEAILQAADKDFVTYVYNDKGKTMKATVPTKYNKHKVGAVEEDK